MFFDFFAVYLKSTSKFENFEEKHDRYRGCVSGIRRP